MEEGGFQVAEAAVAPLVDLAKKSRLTGCRQPSLQRDPQDQLARGISLMVHGLVAGSNPATRIAQSSNVYNFRGAGTTVR